MKAIKKGISDYLRLRAGLGYKPEGKDKGILREFVSFLQAHKATSITLALSVSFAKSPTSALSSHWAARYSVIRRFAQYWKAFDEKTAVLPEGVIPYVYHRPKPYIYSPEEILTVLKQALLLGPSWDPLRKYTYFTLFGLISVTGLRLGEPIGLNEEDVNLNDGILTIRGSKSQRSRLVPLHSSTVKQLKLYISLRNQHCARKETSAFFLSRQGTRLTRDSVRGAFIKISVQSGLRSAEDSHGPRIHDFRHSFAVRTLICWYRKGLDVNSQLPLLSTYLGHVHPSDTYWYLEAFPELLNLAKKRLEKYMGGLV